MQEALWNCSGPRYTMLSTFSPVIGPQYLADGADDEIARDAVQEEPAVTRSRARPSAKHRFTFVYVHPRIAPISA